MAYQTVQNKFALNNSESFSRFLLPTLVVITVVIATSLLLLLTVASSNTNFFDHYYSLLYKVNLAVGALLIIIVSSLAIVLLVRLRRGRFGTRLMTKLGLFFAIVGLLPGVLIYLVSLQFVSRSIESWFDIKTETALEAGLNLGRTTMENALVELTNKAELIAEQINIVYETGAGKGTGTGTGLLLARLQNQFGVQEATLLNSNNHAIHWASTKYNVVPTIPNQTIFRQLKQTQRYAAIETFSENITGQTEFRLRVIVPLAQHATKNLRHHSHFAELSYDKPYLQLLQSVPSTLALNAITVENAYKEYQAKALGRIGLRKMYIGTLTLTLLLVVFIAMILALSLGQQLAKPLLFLLQGTKAIAEGDLSPRVDFSSNDELGLLTQQFSQMTRQLADARKAVDINRLALEQSKAYLESILTNLTAGVLVMDHRFILTTANAGAERIFRQPMTSFIGAPLDHIPALRAFNTAIHAAFSEQEASAARHWQKEIEIQQADDEPLTLLARGTYLPSAAPGMHGFVVVFDDITELLSAQRAAAWREVARRLAHEIKNPLTPIQLSAERLKMKLGEKLSSSDAHILERSVRTIVNQVSAMKKMVDDFRDYARMPPAVMQKLQLNKLIAEVIALYGIDDVNDNMHPVIAVKLAPTLPEIEGDPTQLRQIIHNLVQNALDAVAGNTHAPHIVLTTEVVEYQAPACNDVCEAVKLCIADNGPGFSSRILSRAFEPYVTTKEKGTGLGLAMVKKISEEHGARVELRNGSNGQTHGASVSIIFVKLAHPANPSLT